MRHKGRVTDWRDDQGFGFVTPSLGGDRVFLHISAFSKRTRRPVQNDLVTYQLMFDDRCRPRASNVRFSNDVGADSGRPGPSAVRLAAASGFIILVGAAVFAGRMPPAALALCLGASAIAFVAYALDKSAARNDRWRTPEKTLHLLGLIGGWPGALFAQRILRHKSSKVEFQRVYWVTVAMNCAAFGWLLTENGSAFLAGL